jgi:hypothetical protein
MHFSKKFPRLLWSKRVSFSDQIACDSCIFHAFSEVVAAASQKRSGMTEMNRKMMGETVQCIEAGKDVQHLIKTFN